MKQKKPKTIAQRIRENIPIEPPRSAFITFNCQAISIAGTDVSFGPNCDFVSIEQAREALEWLVAQMEGSVTWK